MARGSATRPGLLMGFLADLWVGVRAKRVRFEMAGGLGGLLVDTRGIPLRLPQHPERRREALDAWQRPLWTAVDA